MSVCFRHQLTLDYTLEYTVLGDSVDMIFMKPPISELEKVDSFLCVNKDIFNTCETCAEFFIICSLRNRT